MMQHSLKMTITKTVSNFPMNNRRNVGFLSSQRRFVGVEKSKRYVSPGPGQYNHNVARIIHRKFNQDPCFKVHHIKTNRPLTLDSKVFSMKVQVHFMFNIGPGAYYIEETFNIGNKRLPRIQWHRNKRLLKDRLNKETSVGPWSYTPNITITKPRTLALIKYRTPKEVDQGLVRQVQLYVEESLNSHKERNTKQRVWRNSKSSKISKGLYNSKSHVKKVEEPQDTGVPGPGSYHNDCMWRSVFGKFGRVKKNQRFINYNNSLIYQSESNLIQNTQPQKHFTRTKTPIPCSFLVNTS